MKISRWMKLNNLTITTGAIKLGLSRTTFDTVVQGGIPNARTALRIQDGTGGAVTVRDLVEEPEIGRCSPANRAAG